jgi:hypothetical protein
MKRNRVQITLANEDSYILDKFNQCINSSAKLYLDRKIYSKLILDSKPLCQSLIKLGCTERKSLILKFPSKEQVPEYLIHHFIRGYFDGDGHISKDKKLINPYYHINITSSEDFIQSLRCKLIENGIVPAGIYKRYKDKEISAHTMMIKSKSVKVFLDYLYKDATIFLTRKHKVYGK